jgi:Flp pilus assembly secretin CpaC
MKRLIIVLGLLAAAPALAQPPEIVQYDDQIDLAVGESKTLKFHEAFKTAGTVTENIASIFPQSDRTLTISGLSPGQTLMFVQAEQGDVPLDTSTD